MEGCQKTVDRAMNITDFDLKIGFIGGGRMAQALSQGFIQSGLVKPANLVCSDPSTRMLDEIRSSTGIHTTSENLEVVRSCDVVILAVKPQYVTDVLQEVSSVVHANHLVISIAAGIKLAHLEKLLPPATRAVRVMPNTPALVQMSASVFSPGSSVRPEDCEIVRKLFDSIGYCIQLPEHHLDAVTGLSGSGPAYGFIMIEALADGGVKMGLPRDIAIKLAAQTLMGSAKMVLETGKHPGELKDMVCSPGGTTIAAVHHLETAGFRGALIGAVEAATTQSRTLSERCEGDTGSNKQ